ncbi:lipase maturation factor 2-like [Branchiostoma floridae]|uniref:Lipase maturation factor n=1 Tax=Branchiostoma floridae TaxID=7739 RepID=A0A9J7L0J8_BRAFL|nr:lipase maturation factor 2-like [Branchiostoma floridae]
MVVSTAAVRSSFLWCMSVIYLLAFSSLYVQIPGLYGSTGILPANRLLKLDGKTPHERFSERPTLLWLTPALGLTAEHGMDLLCLAGMLISLVAMVTEVMRDVPAFLMLWILYFSVYQVGQTFLWFQWDILLLEAGFLAVLAAPLNPMKWLPPSPLPHDNVALWLVRWLLFRLMFASGIVKLTSMCPTWWGLTALNYHYESQCIPTPLAWFAHQLPEWFQKLSVVATYIIEIPIPLLFFAPVRSLRIFSFYAQALLQVLIILSGNYNFFNLLTLTLCLPLLDDKHVTYLFPWLQAKQEKTMPGGNITESTPWQRCRSVLTRGTEVLVYSGLFYWTCVLFKLRLTGFTVQSKVGFTSDQFHSALTRVMPVTIWIGVGSLFYRIGSALIRSFTGEDSLRRKVFTCIRCLLFSAVAVFVFTISLVPHTVIDWQSNNNLWPIVKQWNQRVDKFQLVNSYGLFRRMTGVGGRPEVIVEGSNSLQLGWKEYDFLYKPGNVKVAPPVVAPHQPRLDWQLWFAALGSYGHNPWFVNMVHRLLHGDKNVLALMDSDPFNGKPPKYIRATLYHYHFTDWGKNSSAWWRRERQSEYLPPLQKDDPSLLKFLTHHNLMMEPIGKASSKKPKSMLGLMLQWLRGMLGSMSGIMLQVTLVVTGLVVSWVQPIMAKVV